MGGLEPPFLGEVAGGVAWATFNRPQALNAYSEPMRDLMLPFLRVVEADPAVRCVVLRGAGGNFMAGGDVKSFTEHLAKPPLERQMTFEALCHSMNPIIYVLRRMPKPVVASVAGACAGLGFSFVLAADLALAADNASFTFAYPKIGATPDGGASFFLPRTLGLKRAMEVALFSDRIDAAGAERLGIVNRVVPAAELEAQTRDYVQRLARGATQAYARTKELISQAFSQDLEAQLQSEAVHFAACTRTADMIEGVTAFVEKRKPDFRNK